MKLNNKKIVLVSPQSWDYIKVSKHHYAEELANRGNQVFFLGPPSKKIRFKKLVKKEIAPNLFLVENALFFPYKLKFHLPSFFKYLLKFQVQRIRKLVGNIDVLWSFSHLFSDLSQFNAKLNLYHPVDRLTDRDYFEVAKSADIVFGVTKNILDSINHPNKYLIQHGLSRVFNKPEFKNPFNNSNSIIRVGYCGNLDAKTLDQTLLIDLVKSYQEIEFVFIGPYSNHDENEFINFLKASNNVSLLGKLTPNEVADLYLTIDLFILCYNRLSKYAQQRNKSSNSHKLLEYLASGRVVVSTNLSEFENNLNLIEMDQSDDNNSFREIFSTVINNLSFYNSTDRMSLRIDFARSNSYESRINQIEDIINNQIKNQKLTID